LKIAREHSQFPLWLFFPFSRTWNSPRVSSIRSFIVANISLIDAFISSCYVGLRTAHCFLVHCLVQVIKISVNRKSVDTMTANVKPVSDQQDQQDQQSLCLIIKLF